MSDAESHDDLLDRVVEQILLGQDPDVEGLIANAPDMAPDRREKLRRVARTFSPLDPAAAIERPDELPFTEFGPYQLISRMGEGGMGTVYLAEQRFLKRRVALKVIRPELARSTVARQRFQREAMRVAKLRHDNIVSVYDAGEHDGVAYLAMELVEGPGLDEVLRDARRDGRRMDVRAAVRHARDVALALQCAHDEGIIHRDVKPANVRITPDERALLLDFGLSFEEETPSLSGAGQFLGTPQYASPEQIESGSTNLDARSDVFSLGVTLYECLTGRVPFENASMIALFHQILSRSPPAPRELNDAIDESLNGIVMRAISKRREDRFDSARAMADALEEWLWKSERVEPAPRTGSSTARKSLAAAALVTVIVAGWIAFHHATTDPVGAQPPEQRVVRSTPRRETALFGATSLAFDQRLLEWGALAGSGTFGADDEGPGVIGVSPEGITAKPHALPGGNGCIRGTVDPIAPKPLQRTPAAGAAIEFSNGRIVAVLLVSSANGYDTCVCEITRDGERLTRGTQLKTGTNMREDEGPLNFRLSWNESDTQFEWSADDTYRDSFSIPRRLRDGALPTRFLLLVEKGNARFENIFLEES